MLDLLVLLKNIYGPRVVRASGKDGGQYQSPCPFCADGDDRFVSWPQQLPTSGKCAQHGVRGTWRCTVCGKHGDMIAWLREVEHRTWAEACDELGIPNEKQDKATRPYKPLRAPRPTVTTAATFEPNEYQAPPEQWREHATNLALVAHDKLLHSPSILSWLAGRGLPEQAVRKYRLGYIEGENKPDCIFRNRESWGLPTLTNADGKLVRSFRIDRGVSIPAWGPDGQAWRIRVRRRNCDIRKGDKSDPKYRLIPQPGQPYSAPMVLPPVNVEPDLATWVVVEAELDALAVHWACQGAVGAISILTATGKPDLAAHKLLRRAAMILVATDFDSKPDGSNPGLDGFKKFWPHVYANAKYFPVPIGKDPGEAFGLGVNLAEWVAAGSPLVARAMQDGGAKRKASRPCDPGLAAGMVRRPGHEEDGNLGASESRCCGVQGENGRPAQQVQPGPKRWPVDASVATFDALPLPCPDRNLHSELVAMFAKRGLDNPDSLILCPRTQPAWWCVYYGKACGRCDGHVHCLVDVVQSDLFKAAVAEAQAAAQNGCNEQGKNQQKNTVNG